VEQVAVKMEPEIIAHTIAEALKTRFPEEVKEIREFRGQVSVIVKRDRIKEMMEYLHDTPQWCFSYLRDVCGVDYRDRKEPRFEVVYQLYSVSHQHAIRIRAEVPEEDPVIDSVVGIWDGANWLERECYDMFGIGFKGHPDLRRILMPEDWEGHPLRKDYPLKSELGDKEWKDLKKFYDLAKENRAYEMRQDG
jgi:NADH-quinone oxidoreductase subunit C